MSAKKRVLGRTSQLNQKATWVQILEANEKQHKTDKQLVAMMRKEFPGIHTQALEPDARGMAETRRRYNTGSYTLGHKPKIQSHCFDEVIKKVIKKA